MGALCGVAGEPRLPCGQDGHLHGRLPPQPLLQGHRLQRRRKLRLGRKRRRQRHGCEPSSGGGGGRRRCGQRSSSIGGDGRAAEAWAPSAGFWATSPVYEARVAAALRSPRTAHLAELAELSLVEAERRDAVVVWHDTDFSKLFDPKPAFKVRVKRFLFLTHSPFFLGGKGGAPHAVKCHSQRSQNNAARKSGLAR
jgi:hypothetical protein